MGCTATAAACPSAGIRWQHGPIRYCEHWFADAARPEAADVVYYRQALVRIPGTKCVPKFSFEVDLHSSADVLFAALKADTRTRIRKAEREGSTYESVRPPDVREHLDAICRSFDALAESKGLSPIDRVYVAACADAGVLDISFVRLASGEVAVWHTHLVVGCRATLFTSVSHFRHEADSAARNAVGRANRLAHWRDIVRFQELGLEVYDFGGWYVGETDEELLQVNRFKKEFGGSVVKRFNCTRAGTLRGRAYSGLRDFATAILKSPLTRRRLRSVMRMATRSRRFSGSD